MMGAFVARKDGVRGGCFVAYEPSEARRRRTPLGMCRVIAAMRLFWSAVGLTKKSSAISANIKANDLPTNGIPV
eukprot:6204206-Pleurochrysis_carterae.AAC.1